MPCQTVTSTARSRCNTCSDVKPCLVVSVMKHQAKELSIRIEEERNTKWCRSLYYRLARLSHYILYAFFLLMVLFIAYWLRVWPRYPPISTPNLSLTGTSARLNSVQTSPYAKHGAFHRLRSHNARLGINHRRPFNKKLVDGAQLSGDSEKPIRGYGVHRRHPLNKVREWKENSFHGRYTEDGDGSDKLKPFGKGIDMKGEGPKIVEDDRPRKIFPDNESDMMSETGPDIDDGVDREAEVRRSEGRLHVRKGQMKKSRRRGMKGKRPVISKKRILSEHARRKTEYANNVNRELNIAKIDEEGKIKEIHEKNKYHGNSNIENLKPKENIKKMNILEEMSNKRQRDHSQRVSTGKLDKYSNNIKKIIGRGNGHKEGTVKEVPKLKTSLGSNSWKYKAVRSSGLQKITGSRKVVHDMKDMTGNIPKVKNVLNSRSNPGGRGTLRRVVQNRVNVHHTTQRSDRVQGISYKKLRSKDYMAKQRNINRHVGKVSTPNVARKSQAGIRKDRGHKPGAIITILTRKIRYPTRNVNSPVNTFVTTRSNITLFNHAPKVISKPLKIHNKTIAPRPEKQHVVANEILIPKQTAISLLKPRINLTLLSPVSGR